MVTEVNRDGGHRAGGLAARGGTAQGAGGGGDDTGGAIARGVAGDRAPDWAEAAAGAVAAGATARAMTTATRNTAARVAAAGNAAALGPAAPGTAAGLPEEALVTADRATTESDRGANGRNGVPWVGTRGIPQGGLLELECLLGWFYSKQHSFLASFLLGSELILLG